MKKIRPYEYHLFPRMFYFSCGCSHSGHLNCHLFGHPSFKPEDDCPNKIKKYISLKIQFRKWIEERKRGAIVRYYDEKGKFLYAEFKVNVFFRLLQVLKTKI